MSFWKVKLRKTDRMFSEYIRKRDNWTCQYSFKDYSENKGGLHCSHYFGRGHENVRFDPDNCVALSAYHHKRLGHGEGREEYKELMLKRLGQDGFDRLDIRAHTHKKRDDALDEVIIKELLRT